MANLGRTDDPGETSLAAATAAIITARWNVSARPAWTPPEQAEPLPVRGARATASVRSDGGSGEFSAVYFDPALDARMAAAPPRDHEPTGAGHGPTGYASNGYASNGYASNSYTGTGYASNGYDSNGYDANGYDANGQATNGQAMNGHGTNGYATNDHGRDSGHDSGNGYGAGPADGSGRDGGGNGFGTGLDAPPSDLPVWEPPAYDPQAYEPRPFEPPAPPADPPAPDAPPFAAPPFAVPPFGAPSGVQQFEAHQFEAHQFEAQQFGAQPFESGGTGFDGPGYRNAGFEPPAARAAGSARVPAPSQSAPSQPAPSQSAPAPSAWAPAEPTGGSSMFAPVSPPAESYGSDLFAPAVAVSPATAPAFSAFSSPAPVPTPAPAPAPTPVAPADAAEQAVAAHAMAARASATGTMAAQASATGAVAAQAMASSAVTDRGSAVRPGSDADSGPVEPPSRAPAPRAASYLDEPLPPADDLPFTSSVMSDLAFPEPFITEPYDPGAFTSEPFPADHRDERSRGASDRPTEDRVPSDRRSDRPRHGNRGSHGSAADGESVLPRRVPAVPDVPDLSPSDGDSAFDTEDGVERIVSFLRRYPAEQAEERPDGYDFQAVIAAVKGVPGVSDALLRSNQDSGGHTLRIEFADGADETLVTQQVARILRTMMGLDADPTAQWLTSDESTLDRPTPARGSRRPVVARASVPGAAPAAPRVPVPELRAPGVLGGGRGYPADRRPGPQQPPQVRSRPAAPAAASQPLETQGGHPLPPRPGHEGLIPRVVLEHVQVTTLGLDATIEVRLGVTGTSTRPGSHAVGQGKGPAVDAYLLRLAAAAAGDAVDQVLLDPATGESRGRCFIENVAVVPFAGCEVAVVVMLLVYGAFAEQLAGSAIVSGDPRQAVVRATLSAVNRRLESLIA